MASRKPAPAPDEILIDGGQAPAYVVLIRRRKKRWTTTVTSEGNRKKVLSSTSQLYTRRIDATGPVLDLLSAAMAGKVRVVARIVS